MPVDLDALKALYATMLDQIQHAKWTAANRDACKIADDIPALIAELRELREANRWRPIAEAPRDGSPVDLWTAQGERFTGCEWIRDRWRRQVPGGWVPLLSEITHFRPIPDPPESA